MKSFDIHLWSSFSYAGQQVNRPLLLDDGNELPYLEASDADGGIYGEVSFELADYITGT